MAIPQLEPQDALLIVDVQKCFCHGGQLGVEGGDEVVPPINQLIENAKQGNAKIIASRDWHPPRHASFKEKGGPWPEHCVRDTEEAEFHPDLNLPQDAEIISKGEALERDQYSAFDQTGLAGELRQEGIKRIWVGGLAEDVCVFQTVMDALEAGFEVHLVVDATRPVELNPGDGKRARERMHEAGAIMESFESHK